MPEPRNSKKISRKKEGRAPHEQLSLADFPDEQAKFWSAANREEKPAKPAPNPTQTPVKPAPSSLAPSPPAPDAPAAAPKPAAKRKPARVVADKPVGSKRRVPVSQVIAGGHDLPILSALSSTSWATVLQIGLATGTARASVVQGYLRSLADLGWVDAKHYGRPDGGGRYPSLYALTRRGHRAAMDAGNVNEADINAGIDSPLDGWFLPDRPFGAARLPRSWDAAQHDLRATDTVLTLLTLLRRSLDGSDVELPIMRWRREVELRPQPLPDPSAGPRRARLVRWHDTFKARTDRSTRPSHITDDELMPGDHAYMPGEEPVPTIRADGLIEVWGDYRRRLDLLVEFDWEIRQSANLAKLAHYSRFMTLWWWLDGRYSTASQPLMLFFSTGERLRQSMRFAAQTAVHIQHRPRSTQNLPLEDRWYGPERILFIDYAAFPDAVADYRASQPKTNKQGDSAAGPAHITTPPDGWMLDLSSGPEEPRVRRVPFPYLVLEHLRGQR